MDYKILSEDFYLKDTLYAAENLLGKYIIRDTKKGLIAGRINETEAYIGPVDKACHAYNYKMTERTKPLFNQGGIAYVYFIYGRYHCLNAVTDKAGEPCAVLIRGAEIVCGRNEASLFRYGKPYGEISKSQAKNLANGPGKLCMAMDIDRSHNMSSLSSGELIIAESISGIENKTVRVRRAKRIGIGYAEEAVDFLWRFIGE